MASIAGSDISKASFVLSNHAKLDDLASDADLVAETRKSHLDVLGVNFS